jgi:hypothetical protein
MACRSDLTTEVDPKHASKLQRYDVGLVSVTTKTKAGKAKIRDSFNWILKAIVRDLEGMHFTLELFAETEHVISCPLRRV